MIAAPTTSVRPEAAAKAAFLNAARRVGLIKKGTLIANEFVLGGSGVRADLAIFNEQITAVEVKTARDTLRRLEGQLSAYRAHCARIILVVAECHIDARVLSQPDLELWAIRSSGKVERVRTSSTGSLESSAIPLLTKAELRRLSCQGALTQEAAVGAIAERFRSSNELFWSNVGRRIVRVEHLEALSRFRAARDAAIQLSLREEAHWAAWERAAAAFFQEQSKAAA